MAVTIESLYKDKYGQLIALLLQRFRDLNLESAEDIVQETFTKAAEIWPQQGMPENPAGWLYQTCKNTAINLLKRSRKAEYLTRFDRVSALSHDFSDENLKDIQLRMLMACCHPDLTPKTQVVIALKYVVNLRIDRIAWLLGVSPDAIEKMLYRARQKIRTEKIIFTAHLPGFAKERLSVVHKVIYLIFNEGFKKPGREIKTGKKLCEESLLLNTYLLDSALCNAETKALQALMLFNIARFETRFDEDGNAIELEYQERSQWNTSLIRLGHLLLIDSEAPRFTPYHLEASIAYMHCSAAKFEDTDWNSICKYYETLLNVYPSPFAELNYAVALQYNGKQKKACRILMDLSRNPYLHQSRILNLSLGRYFERLGKKEKAEAYFEKVKNECF